MSFMKPIT